MFLTFQEWYKEKVYRKVFVYFHREYWRKNDTSNRLVHEIHCVSEHFTGSFCHILKPESIVIINAYVEQKEKV